MLASARDYLFMWQLPLLLVFLGGWVFGGGWLLHRTVQRLAGGDRKATLPRCVVAVLLAGLGGAFGGAVLFGLINKIGAVTDAELLIPGLVIGALVALVLGYLVIYAMFSMSAKRTLKVAAVPMVGVVLLAGVVAAAAGVPAWYIRQGQIARDSAEQRLRYIHAAVRNYQLDRAAGGRLGPMPPSLDVLVQERIVDAKILKSPGLPDRDKAFFYHPPAELTFGEADSKLLACEVASHDGGRAVLLIRPAPGDDTRGEARWLSDEEFEQLLQEPQNREFAEALRAAEGG